MKNYILSIIMLTVLTLFINSCASKKVSQTNANQESEISENKTNDTNTIPCSEAVSDKNSFRINHNFKSSDKEISKENAISSGKKELNIYVNSLIKSSYEIYFSEEDSSRSFDYGPESEFFQTINASLYGELNNLLLEPNIICEKTVQSTDSLYITYISIELTTENVINTLSEIITKNTWLNSNFNLERFKVIYNNQIQNIKE